MKRLLLLPVACFCMAVGVFLFFNPVGVEADSAGTAQLGFKDTPMPFILNWFLRLVFAGGGAVLIVVCLFGSDKTVNKAMRGMKDAL
jgi:hypothetical protein